MLLHIIERIGVFCVSEIQKNNLKKIIIKMIILKFLLIQNLKKMAS